jgi:hypothetical protein
LPDLIRSFFFSPSGGHAKRLHLFNSLNCQIHPTIAFHVAFSANDFDIGWAVIGRHAVTVVALCIGRSTFHARAYIFVKPKRPSPSALLSYSIAKPVRVIDARLDTVFDMLIRLTLSGAGFSYARWPAESSRPTARRLIPDHPSTARFAIEIYVRFHGHGFSLFVVSHAGIVIGTVGA